MHISLGFLWRLPQAFCAFLRNTPPCAKQGGPQKFSGCGFPLPTQYPSLRKKKIAYFSSVLLIHAAQKKSYLLQNLFAQTPPLRKKKNMFFAQEGGLRKKGGDKHPNE